MLLKISYNILRQYNYFFVKRNKIIDSTKSINHNIIKRLRYFNSSAFRFDLNYRRMYYYCHKYNINVINKTTRWSWVINSDILSISVY